MVEAYSALVVLIGFLLVTQTLAVICYFQKDGNDSQFGSNNERQEKWKHVN